MQIYYDNQFTQELTEKIEKYFWNSHKERTEIHLTDLCHCPLKIWCRLTGIPEIRDDNAVGIMMIGVVGQTIIQNLYPKEQIEFEPDKDLPEDEQLPSHLDVFADMKMPLECKWSRKNIARGTDIEKSWIMQDTGYMAKTKSPEGKMVIFNVMTGKLNCFRLILSPEELEQRSKELKDDKHLIKTSVINKDPNLLTPWGEECAWCSYRPSRKRTKEGKEACPKYVEPKLRGLPQDQSPVST